MRPNSRWFALFAAIGLVIFGCDTPSAPQSVAITLEPLFAGTDLEPTRWRGAPIVTGGSMIEIRGIALAGCGTLQAEASRRERTIEVRITTWGDQQPCVLARPAWQRFVARVGGLRPDEYRVRMNVVGHNRRTISGVKVGKPPG